MASKVMITICKMGNANSRTPQFIVSNMIDIIFIVGPNDLIKYLIDEDEKKRNSKIKRD